MHKRLFGRSYLFYIWLLAVPSFYYFTFSFSELLNFKVTPSFIVISALLWLGILSSILIEENSMKMNKFKSRGYEFIDFAEEGTMVFARDEGDEISLAYFNDKGILEKKNTILKEHLEFVSEFRKKQNPPIY